MADTMLEVITIPAPTLHTNIQTVPIPHPGPHELVIRVAVASSNVKDWLHPTILNKSLNSGDDLAGTVHAIGSAVTKQCKIGDRVAAFHQMGMPHGAYAEYAVAPEHTVLHVPDNVIFHTASTIPLISTTAAITLFRRLGFRAPWLPASENDATGPLIIYGASSALGTFTIKLAKLAGIHPLIAIGGGSSEYVKDLLETEKGDALVEYRRGTEKMKEDVAQALDGKKARRASDCISSNQSWVPVAEMLDGAGGSIMSVVAGSNKYDEPEIPDGVQILYTYVGSAHEGRYRENAPKQPPASEVEGDVEFAGQLFEYLEGVLKSGEFEGHPYEVVPGGLEGVETGLMRLKNKEAKGVKFVYEIAGKV